MSNDDGTLPAQSPARTRRSSFAGQTFADLFGSGRSSVSRQPSQDVSGSPPGGSQKMGPITQAAAQAQQRRLSLSTLGINGAGSGGGGGGGSGGGGGGSTGGGQTSPFQSFRERRASISSANSGSIDESAIEDDGGGGGGGGGSQPTPSSPFARRMSFGAQALRDVRSSRGGASGGGGGGTGAGAGQNEGFNWSENLRSRAERTSISGPPPGGLPFGSNAGGRHKSAASVESPVKEMPRPQKRPDHFQERILKGDFYMD